MKKWSSHVSAAVLLILLLLTAWAILAFPKAVSQGVSAGINASLNVLIPSLFPFMVLSTYLVKSGLAAKTGKGISAFMGKVFHLPGACAPVLLMSLVGGYPVGAKGTASLLAENAVTKEEAGRMLCFCINSGPPFVLTVVGFTLLGRPKAGVLLLCALIISGIILGIICAAGSPKPNLKTTHKNNSEIKKNALVASVSDSCRAMLQMCAFVLLFSAFIYLLRQTGVSQSICKILLRLGVPAGNAAAFTSFLLEVTSGCNDGALLHASLPMFAFGLGWGGLCVHFQIFSFFKDLPISRSKFWLFRFLHGILAAVITSVLLRFFPEVSPALATCISPVTAKMASSAPAALAMLLMFAIVVLDGMHLPMKNKEKNISRSNQ